MSNLLRSLEDKDLACPYFAETQEKNLESIIETKKKPQNVLAGKKPFFQV